MPTKVWVPGEAVLSADFNDYVQEQVIPVFTNAAQRDAQLPAPYPGQHCYLADQKVLLQYTDRTSPASWRRPWSEPWGNITSYVVPDMRFGTTPGYLIGGGFTGLSVPNRTVRAKLSGGWVVKDVDGYDAFVVFRIVGGPPPHTVLRDSLVTLHQGWAAQLEVEATFPTETYNQFHFFCWTSAGTAATGWLRVVADDLGPSPLTPLA